MDLIFIDFDMFSLKHQLHFCFNIRVNPSKHSLNIRVELENILFHLLFCDLLFRLQMKLNL